MFGPLFPDHQGIGITAVRITEGPQCAYQDPLSELRMHHRVRTRTLKHAFS